MIIHLFKIRLWQLLRIDNWSKLFLKELQIFGNAFFLPLKSIKSSHLTVHVVPNVLSARVKSESVNVVVSCRFILNLGVVSHCLVDPSSGVSRPQLESLVVSKHGFWVPGRVGQGSSVFVPERMISGVNPNGLLEILSGNFSSL